ncbi:MAG: hypothetical protein GTN93_31975 [Anaerolineae bacterium]|nr:hypothetical protein [Anaerolineae bacterium]
MRALRTLSLSIVMVVAAIAAGVFVGVVMGNEMHSSADAATTSHLTLLSVREDRFWNYDFNSKTVSSTNVDWPLGVLYWNNAEVDKVKGIYGSWFPYGGGAKYLRLKDGTSYVWDQDGGRKNNPCPIWQQSARHIRIYADSDDRLYNVSWGYYVLASSHKDWQECWAGSQFGWSEESEGIFVAFAQSRGYAAAHDWGNFFNYEAPRWEGNHYWDNNGYASAVNVP